MFHVRTNTQLFVAVRLVEPILPLDVVGFLFSVVESRCSKCQRTGIAKVACSTNGAEECLKLILLLAVEIDFETLDVLHRAKLRLAIRRLKIVVVAVNIGNAEKNVNADWQIFSGGSDFLVGVDIEPIDRTPHTTKISKRFLSVKEREYVAGDRLRFLEIWTKKESASKLTGEGVGAIANFCSFEHNNICIETRRVMLGGKEYIVSVSYYKTLD